MSFQKALQALYSNGYQRREAQEQMAQMAYHVFESGDIGVIEGGTGIGKSIAYTIPALLARNPGQKVIIATGTIALQEQLIHGDLPKIRQMTGLNFTFHLAKSRTRYLCPSRLAEMVEYENTMTSMFTDDSEVQVEADTDTLYDMQKAFDEGGWDGDRDNWTSGIDGRSWSAISTDRIGCAGKSCAYISQCPYFLTRRKMDDADVVVTNHSLLLADVSLGTGKILPKAEDSLYVIDEGHNFTAKAVDELGANSTVLGVLTWLDSMKKGFKKLPYRIDTLKSIQMANEIAAELETIHQIFTQNFNSQKNKDDVWMIWKLPEELQAHASNIAKVADQLSLNLAAINDAYRELCDDSPSFANSSLFSTLGFVLNRANNLATTWKNLQIETEVGKPPVARWITPHRQDDDRPDFMVHTAPTSAAAQLKSMFWDKCENGVVMCSATLRTLGTFDRFLRQSGLKLLGRDRVKTAAFLSPFNYQKSTLLIPAMKTVPQGINSGPHTSEVTDYLKQEINRENGTLVIFTSKRMMQEIYDQLPVDMHNHILMQGQYQKKDLIQKHREKIQIGDWSVIFGLDSFAEGVDLPGNLCTSVIITKLKFAVPNTPIEMVKSEYIKQINRNPFMELSLPDASTWLTQAVGRLIRTMEDYGTVVMLDRRIVTKQYGGKLLANLPPFKVIIQ